MTKSLRNALTVVALLSSAPYLSAQGYPNQPINLVIPLGPGDAADVAARTMGEELSKLLKVPIVPVNRPGGGMTIGTDAVVKAKKTATPFYSRRAPLSLQIGYSIQTRLPMIR